MSLVSEADNNSRIQYILHVSKRVLYSQFIRFETKACSKFPYKVVVFALFTGKMELSKNFNNFSMSVTFL